MKPLLLFSCCAAAACAQQAAPTAAPAPWTQLPDSETIAVLDGKPLTVGQFRTFISMDPRAQQLASTDPADLVRQMALMRKLTALALEQKLDSTSPWREQLEYNRQVTLSQAAAQYLVISQTVDESERTNYYNAHKEDYRQVKVKAIKIAFGTASKSGPKVLTEEEAKVKAARLLAAIRGGADFVRLVHENSDDATSKARDGDFATLTPSDNIPDAMRAAVFRLKAGETSEPVRQPDGYYLLRADQVSYLPLSQVQDEIFGRIRAEKGNELAGKMNRELKIEFPNPAFPGKPPAAK